MHAIFYLYDVLSSFRCSTTVESFPSTPTYSSDYGEKPELQKMRVLIGAPLRQPPKHQMVADSLLQVFPSVDANTTTLNREQMSGPFHEEKSILPEGLSDFLIFCTSDFTTVSKEVHVRTRRVRLLGLEVLLMFYFYWSTELISIFYFQCSDSHNVTVGCR